jgi:hypothetical protein
MRSVQRAPAQLQRSALIVAHRSVQPTLRGVHRAALPFARPVYRSTKLSIPSLPLLSAPKQTNERVLDSGSARLTGQHCALGLSTKTGP